MASPQEFGRPIQDGPPKGGYPQLNFARKVPKRVPGAVIWAGCALAITTGMYRVHHSNMDRRSIAHERRELRLSLAPYLQAEEDVRFIQASQKAKELETEIMKEVPGWKAGASVYHNKKIWIRPPCNDLNY